MKEWMLREQARFDSGLYKKLPWHNELEAIGNHYAHISTNDAGLVAFTPNEEMGVRNIKTTIKPGRYLKQFYPALSAFRIKELSEKLIGSELFFASDPDDIENVYLNGPGSCMAAGESFFESSVHPVRVYGDSDVQVAYLKHKDQITARALVWPEKKYYYSIYGDCGRLRNALEEAGYQQNELNGARLTLIKEDKNTIVCPYIDSGLVSIRQENLYIGGGIDATSTSGIIYVERCYLCDSYCDRNAQFKIKNNLRLKTVCICDDCSKKDNIYYCTGTNAYYDENDFPSREAHISITNRKKVTQKYYDNSAMVCAVTGLTFIHHYMYSADINNKRVRICQQAYIIHRAKRQLNLNELKREVERSVGVNE